MSLNTDKIDLTEFPADLVSQAVETQKALEELLNPFVESQSTLLSSLEKIQSGLTEGSKKFSEVADAIKRVQQTWDLFDAAMEDTLSSDQLIEAFDKYFSGMLDVLADTVGKVPGLGAFLQAYATAIHNIVPTLKSISAATLAKNESIANVCNQPTETTTTSAASPSDIVSEQIASLDSRIEALDEERWNLLDEVQKEAAKNAKTTRLIGDNLRTQSTLRAQRIVELENLVLTNSHGLAKITIAVGAGIAAVAIFGAFLFTSGGNECSTTGALTAAGVHITASSDPCPQDDADLVSVTDDTLADDPIDESPVSVTDDTIGEELNWGDEEIQVEEREPVFAPFAGDLEAGLVLAGATSFKWLVETVDDNAYTMSGTGGPVVIDPPGDQIYSDPSVRPFMRAAAADILVTQRLTLEAAWALIETPLVPDGDFGCDRADELVIVVCPDSDLPFPDEPAAWVFVGMNASIPAVEGGPGEFIYSYVLDADGDPANDWQTQGPYTWDFYQGTDTWFELIRGAEDGEWRATTSRVTADQQIEPIDLPFRVIIWDNIIWWWVPESSAPTDAPFRVSAFAHDGTYSPRSSSGDVPGANPTEGLLP